MSTQDEFIMRVNAFKEEMKKEIKDAEKVLGIKEMTDEMIIEISTTIESFCLKQELLKNKPILAACVSHRALFFLGNCISYEWAIDAVAARHVRIQDFNGKKCQS